MRSLLLSIVLFLIQAQEANCRFLRWHRGRGGHGGMMQEGGGMMMNENDGEMMMGQGDMTMMMGDCHEMMENGGMMGGSTQMVDDEQCPMSTIHKLLNHRNDITRLIKDTQKGVRTKTFSASPEINTWIRHHVESMMELVHSGHRIRNWDGLFEAMFDHAADMELLCHDDNDTGGVQCRFRAEGDCAIGLAQAHARVVSSFLKNGWDEVRKDHADLVPESCLETSN